MPDTTAIVFSDYSSGHDTGTHPESQPRLDAVRARLESAGLLIDRLVEFAEPVSPDIITRVHDPSVVHLVREMSELGGGAIDGDTFVTPGSYEAGLAAAGAAIKAVDLVLSREQSRAFSMARPPGHHAERNRQMGFCLFNNIAVAAMHAMQEHGVSKIAIIDWDVHHGNGTQEIFYESPDVLFCSIHQWPLFPGTGLASERGAGAGSGFTINVPLPTGAGDRDVLVALDELVIPAVRSLAPDLIMVSAGFDAHRDDPLAMMEVSERGFAEMALRMRSLADDVTDGKLVLTLEGGYNLRALSESVVATLIALDTPAPEERGQ